MNITYFNFSELQIINKIGEGPFAQLFRTKDMRMGLIYCAKIFSKPLDELKGKSKNSKNIEHEVVILSKLRHPLIVNFIGFNSTDFQGNPKPVMISEYMPKFSLTDLIQSAQDNTSEIKYDDTQKLIIIYSIACAMSFLHSQKIVHCHLKPNNILFDDNYYPKITDFFLTKYTHQNPKKLLNAASYDKSAILYLSPEAFSASHFTKAGEFGTPLYLPPEILRGDDSYDQSVDVYAFSMIAYEIVTRIQPFSELGQKISPFKLINDIINGYRPSFPDFVTKKMQKLISKCWSNNPEERPTFKEIFDELSTDMSYSDESLDEPEVQDYIFFLSESNEQRSKKTRKINKSINDDEEVNKLKQEVNEMKLKLTETQSKQELNLSSEAFLHNGIKLLLGDKKSRNINKAIKQLQISSQKGNNKASFILGLIYESGEEVELNMKESLKYYEESAKQGNSDALFSIGTIYDSGNGIEKNSTKAIEYFEKSSKLGNSNALHNLGLIYMVGNGVKENLTKAKDYFEEASKYDNPSALHFLGLFYSDGKIVKQDYIKAKECFEKAVELGDDNSLNNIGIIYRDGKGVERDYIKAKEYFEKAAKLGDTIALSNLGYLYDVGLGVNRNFLKAIKYYRKAAELGDDYAKERLKEFREQTDI